MFRLATRTMQVFLILLGGLVAFVLLTYFQAKLLGASLSESVRFSLVLLIILAVEVRYDWKLNDKTHGRAWFVRGAIAGVGLALTQAIISYAPLWYLLIIAISYITHRWVYFCLHQMNKEA
jgi:hypothetical protein